MATKPQSGPQGKTISPVGSQRMSFAAIVGGSPRPVPSKPVIVQAPSRHDSSSPENSVTNSDGSGEMPHTPSTPTSPAVSPAPFAKTTMVASDPVAKSPVSSQPSAQTNNSPRQSGLSSHKVLSPRKNGEQDGVWTSWNPMQVQKQAPARPKPPSRVSSGNLSENHQVSSYAAAAMGNSHKGHTETMQKSGDNKPSQTVMATTDNNATNIVGFAVNGVSSGASGIQFGLTVGNANQATHPNGWSGNSWMAQTSPRKFNVPPTDGNTGATSNGSVQFSAQARSFSSATVPPSTETTGNSGQMSGSSTNSFHPQQGYGFGYRKDFGATGQRSHHHPPSHAKNDSGIAFHQGPSFHRPQMNGVHGHNHYNNFQQASTYNNTNYNGLSFHPKSGFNPHNQPHHAAPVPQSSSVVQPTPAPIAPVVTAATAATTTTAATTAPNPPTTPSRLPPASPGSGPSPGLSPLSVSFNPTSSHHFTSQTTPPGSLSPQASTMVRRIKSIETCGVPIEQTPQYEYQLENLAHPSNILINYGYRIAQFTMDELERKRKCQNCLKNIYNRPKRTNRGRRNNTSGMYMAAGTDLLAPLAGTETTSDAPAEVQDERKTKEDELPKCKYHPGPMQGRFFACCSGTQFNNPCATAMEHTPLKATLPELAVQWKLHPTRVNPSSPRKCIAIDCEMGVSRDGDSELIRVTAIDYFTGEILIDKLVYPTVPMLHLNTVYSGVSWSQLNRARYQGQAFIGRDSAREAVQCYVDRDTIIVGHSVNHDLMALRWLHCNVIDTLLLDLIEDKREQDDKAKRNVAYEKALFEYQTGKRADAPVQPDSDAGKSEKKGRSLKALSLERLGRTIQTGEHDSLEDTLASRDLLHWWVTNRAQDLLQQYEDAQNAAQKYVPVDW